MLKNKPLNIIIDTNVWIYFLISGTNRKLDQIILNNKIRILFSVELINEITKTASKPKLKKYFGPNAVEEMLLSFNKYINLIEVKSVISVCRDSKDNFLLELARDGNANYLLTGDKDLLILKKFDSTIILTISDFINETG